MIPSVLITYAAVAGCVVFFWADADVDVVVVVVALMTQPFPRPDALMSLFHLTAGLRFALRTKC